MNRFAALITFFMWSAAVAALPADGVPGKIMGGLSAEVTPLSATMVDTEWVRIGGVPPEEAGVNGNIRALVFDNTGNLYVGGDFYSAGGFRTNCIAQWNGSKWESLKDSLWEGVFGTRLFISDTICRVSSLACDHSGNIYISGTFLFAARIRANNIAKWNGTNWSAMGKGLKYGSCTAIALDKSGILYAGGTFDTIGQTSARNIAKWDGTVWSPLGDGLNGSIEALAVDSSGDLYVAGSFDPLHWNPVRCVARWNGSGWRCLGNDIFTSYSYIRTISCDGAGNVYIGGLFNLTDHSGKNAVNIARWDGRVWSALGEPPDAPINSMAFDKSGNLLVGGSFSTIGEINAKYIAMWDGSSWSGTVNGPESPANVLVFDHNNNLFVSGDYTMVNGKKSAYLAKRRISRKPAIKTR